MELFQEMMSAPTDQSLMLAYARQAVAEKDYEAAVATLERLVDLDPASAEARFELATAYYALGSNDVARYHFTILQNSGVLSTAEWAEVTAYQKAAAQRDKPLSFSGYVDAGIANLPDQGETGVIASFGLMHRYDFGGPSGTDFITSLRADYLHFGSGTVSGQRAINLAAGPSFRLNGDRFGPTLRPYFALRSSQDDEPSNDRDMYGMGASIDVPLSSIFSAFANIEGGRVKFELPGNDGDYLEGQIGLSWLASRSTLVRASVLSRDIDVADPMLDSTFKAARVEVTHDFRPSFATRDWTVRGFVQVESEQYESFRKDDGRRVGASLRAFVTQKIYVQGDLQYFDRTSDVPGFEAEEPLIALRLGMEF
jgi:hypothetical protein